MQTFGAFLVSLIASSGMAAALPASTGTTMTVTAAHNPKHIASGPLALAGAYNKFGTPIPKELAAVVEKIKQEQLSKRQTTGTTPTTPDPADYDREYLTKVSIGSPAQDLFLDFDTGSSDLWVFSTETRASEVKGQRLYDPKRSSTAKRVTGATWNIRYGDQSSSSGDVWSDAVTIGGLTVKNQAVEAAKEVSDQFTNGTPKMSGLLGLAFDNINTVKPQKQKTWFTNIAKSLKAPVFTANLKHQQDGTYNFGYVDSTEFKGKVIYTPVDKSEGFWTFTSSGYAVGSGRPAGSPITGIADTGTSLLLIDDAIVEDYYSRVSGAKLDNDQGGYTFPCSAKLPDFIFGVESSSITIPGALVNYAPIDETGQTCFGGLQSNGGSLNIFGDVALKAAVVVFDAGQTRLGWAQK